MQRASVHQPQLLLASRGHHLEDVKLNPFHLVAAQVDHLVQGVLPELLELVVLVRQMHREVR
jgi:hypothetical protein